MAGNAHKQGLRRGACHAREAWKAFKRTGNVSDLDLGGQERDFQVLETERPYWAHLNDQDWEAFALGFQKGRIAEIKKLAKTIAPPPIVRKAPLVCAIVDAMREFGGPDQSWGPSQERVPVRVSMAGALRGGPARSVEGRKDGTTLADQEWDAFSAACDVAHLTLSDRHLAEKAEQAFAMKEAAGEAPDARAKYVESFKDAYGARLDRLIQGLIPPRLQEWAQHIRVLFGALGIDAPGTQEAMT